MNWNQLTTQNVALLAVVATIASSTIAATAALVSTLVSGWNGRRLERQTALRAYRLQLLTGAIANAESRIGGVSLVRHHGRHPIDALYPDGQEPITRKLSVTPTDELRDAAATFAVVDLFCWHYFRGTPSIALDPTEQKWLLDQLERAALVYREAIENFVFGDRFSPVLGRSLTREREATIATLDALKAKEPAKLSQPSDKNPGEAEPSNQRLQPTAVGRCGIMRAATAAAEPRSLGRQHWQT